ncbi:MAG: ATP-grasp domain-containing protein, partial [Candidatus Shapirobacteria bacterium]|nr:ATP-grasp domain-containing protein [Candidatus Shapirobacteria bacterium]
SNPGPINRFLEDQIKFAKLCKKYKLPTIPFSLDTFSQKNFLKYQKLYSRKLVIQTHFGWAGKSTFSAESWDEIKNKISSGIIVKYSPFIQSSYSLLNNCCLTKFGLIQSPPALQYTGISPYTKNPFTTVGRQWPSFAPLKTKGEINKITEKFGKILKEIGYKGFFGLDFLVYKNKVFLLECNPRLTASFGFYTTIEEKQNITPLFYFHLAEFLKLDYQIDIKKEKTRFNNKKIIGSELTPKDKNNHTCQKLNFNFPLSKTTNPISLKIK